MPGTYSQILLHVVFSTSRREPCKTPELGASLHLGGDLTRLRRTAIGPFDGFRAYPLDDVPDPIERQHLLPVNEID